MNLDKRSHILETARQLFASRGFEGASIRDIAEVAKVNISAISYYFGSKDKLLEALFDDGAEIISSSNESILQNTEIGYKEKMNLFITHQVERAITNQQFYRLIISEQMMNRNPVIIGRLNSIKHTQIGVLAQLISQGRAAGDFPSQQTDARMLFNIMIGSISQILIDRDDAQWEAIHTSTAELDVLRQTIVAHIKMIFYHMLGSAPCS